MPALKKLTYFLAFFLTLPFFLFAADESITVTTYYPSPYGVYKEMRAQRMAVGDNYVQGSEYCWEGTCTTNINANADLVVEGNVGIGTVAPGGFLEIYNSDNSVNNGNTKATVLLRQTSTPFEIRGFSSNGRVLQFSQNATPTQAAGASPTITKYNNGYGSNQIVLFAPDATGEDTTTAGIYFNTAKTTEDSATTTRMFIQTSGNVGIGTTAPAQLLHLAKDNHPILQLQNTNATNPSTFRLMAGGGYGDNRSFVIDDGSAAQLVINTSGNVGIGTTSPSKHLDITDNSDASGLIINHNTTKDKYINIYQNDVTTYFKGSHSMRFWVNGGTDSLYLKNDGYVGIGTTNPRYKLDVIGDIRATGSVYYGGTSGSTDGTAYTKPDYVFSAGYNVMTTDAVEAYLLAKNHLPWMTPLKEEKQGAIDMTRMSFETVETAENLQLQIIALNKEIKALRAEIAALKGGKL